MSDAPRIPAWNIEIKIFQESDRWRGEITFEERMRIKLLDYLTKSELMEKITFLINGFADAYPHPGNEVVHVSKIGWWLPESRDRKSGTYVVEDTRGVGLVANSIDYSDLTDSQLDIEIARILGYGAKFKDGLLWTQGPKEKGWQSTNDGLWSRRGDLAKDLLVQMPLEYVYPDGYKRLTAREISEKWLAWKYDQPK